MDPIIAELLTSNRLLHRQIADFDRRLSGFGYVQCCRQSTLLTMTPRPTVPYSGGSYASLPIVQPTPLVNIPPTQNALSNLEMLYKASPEAKMPNPLRHTDHIDCMFWEEATWTRWVEEMREIGSIGPGTGRSINSSWLEDSNGIRVDRNRQGKVLDEMRATWLNMEDFNIPIKRFTSMPATSLNYFRARMESVCPELQLCADHWKADRLWKENFSASVFRREVRF